MKKLTDFISKHQDALLWTGLVLVIIAQIYYHFSDTKTAEQKGRKTEIQAQISVQDAKRTLGQKIVWEAFQNGLNATGKTEKKQNEDERSIKIYVIALDDSTAKRIFEQYHGQLNEK